ncbi:MAG: hypothetical protein CMG71_02885 [Candidatus Marinimicrobia bacterium]|nr:hypothetical protein [Candidatus Neomarinimicrobiota bacterium]|tara:strand:- start:9178 stop:9531 length:354 start_codon:yes stop_codon:yes gene_type:complete
MTNQGKFIFLFLMVTLVAALLVGFVRRTWFHQTFDTSELEVGSEAIAQMAEASIASMLFGENIISNFSLEKVNLNTASKSELISFPGIGLAERIITRRHEFGGFTEIYQLMNVKDIG